MSYVDFVGVLHNQTERDYVERVVSHDKAAAAEVACQWGSDYWDGSRQYGYGGYHYDGRWRRVAEAMVRHYNLPADARILDVGCGKGFMLYEFTQLLPEADAHGLDISSYAVQHSKPEIRAQLVEGCCTELPWPDDHFDFVYSITTLHNLYHYDLIKALSEIQRVSRGPKHVTIESYRNEQEKANLLYWQLTCRAFHTPPEWVYIFEEAGYDGDYGAIFFQ